MPKVPHLNELQIDVKGLPNTQFTAGQARHAEAAQVSDVASRARMQSMPRDPGINQRPLQGVQFSDFAARQQIAMGQAISQFSDVIREAGIREADEMDRARFNDAKNQYDAAILDAKNNQEYGWAGTRGIAALPDTDRKSTLESRVFDRLTPAREKIMASLGNDRQRQAFADYAAEVDMRQKQAIAEHVLRESKRWQAGGIKASGELAGNMIATGDAQDFGLGVARIEETLAAETQFYGYSPEQVEQRRKELVSPYMTMAINARIDAGDIQGAMQIRAEHDAYLLPEHNVKLAATLKTAESIQRGKAMAQALLSGGEIEFVDAKDGDLYASLNTGFNYQEYRKRAFGAESSHNNKAYNKSTGAYGKGQFLGSTWMEFGNSGIGRKLRGNMSKEEWLEKRSDPQIMEAAMAWYTDQSRRHLEANNVPWNYTTAYGAHVAGRAGLVAIYQADPNMTAAEALQKAGIKNWKLMVEKNPTILGNGLTTSQTMQIFAKKVNVKPNSELPTGKPQKREYLSDAQLRKIAMEVMPNDPDGQQAFISAYTTDRNVQLEAMQKQHDEALLQVIHILDATNGDMSAVPPSYLAALDGQDRRRLEEYALRTQRHNDALIEAHNAVYMLEMTSKESLARLNEAAIEREWLDGKMSTAQMKQTTKLLRTYQESLEREKRGEKPSLFNFNDAYYSKQQFYDRVQQWAGIDKHDSPNAKERRQLDRIELYAKQEGQRILDESLKAGVPFDTKAYEAALMRIMREEFRTGKTGFFGGEKVDRLYNIPIGDAPFTSIMDAADSLQEAQQFEFSDDDEWTHDPLGYGPIW